MKKIYLILIALVTLISLQSCEKSGTNSADLGPISIFLLVNKHSDLYKEMEKAFAKNDYTNHAPEDWFKPGYDGKEDGFNNVYFFKDNKKTKLGFGLKDSNSNEAEPNYIVYKQANVSKDYAYIWLFSCNLFAHEILTGKKENLFLIYDDKKLSLKIKGKFGNNYSFAKVEHFSVNGKKMKILKSHFTHNVVLFLTE